MIEDADEVYVSAASIWEIRSRRDSANLRRPAQAGHGINASGFIELPVTAGHAAGVGQLAHHHNDPFDRLLISQALAEPLRLLTADEMVMKYSDVVCGLERGNSFTSSVTHFT